jgi:hypothetical protein
MTTPRGTSGDAPAAAFAKGSTLRATLAWARGAAGDEAEARIVARLAPDDRAAVAAAASTDEVPFALVDRLSRAVDAELGAAHPDWAEAIGALAIESLGVQLYGNLLRRASPLGFLTQEVSLFRLYYHPGDIRPVEIEETAEGGRVVLRLDGFGHAATGSRWFCRRQTGGLARAASLAGGERVRARHVRCALEGDAFCEWELRWTTRPPAAGG